MDKEELKQLYKETNEKFVGRVESMIYNRVKKKIQKEMRERRREKLKIPKSRWKIKDE